MRKMDGTGEMPAGAAVSSQAKGRGKKKRMWTCDVCKILKFEDFNEACQHEEECRKALQQQECQSGAQVEPMVQQPVASTKEIIAVPEASHADNDNGVEEASRKKRRTSKESITETKNAGKKVDGLQQGDNAIEVSDTPLLKATNTTETLVVDNDDVDDCVHVLNFLTDKSPKPTNRRKKRKSGDRAKAVDDEDFVEILPSKSKENREKTNSSEKQPVDGTGEKKAPPSTAKATTGNWLSTAATAKKMEPKRASARNKKRGTVSASTNGESDEIEIIDPPGRNGKQPTKKTNKAGAKKAGKTKVKETLPTAFFGGMSSQEVLAQQRIAEFQAKRLAQQQKEKERRLKRDKNKEATEDKAEPAKSNPAMAFFSGQSSKASLAQRKTAEFQAKLLAKQKEDKERNERRNQQKSTSQKPSVVIKPQNRRTKDNKHAAPRFPNPTHVVSRNTHGNFLKGRNSYLWQPTYKKAEPINLDSSKKSAESVNLLSLEDRQWTCPHESRLANSRVSGLLSQILSRASTAINLDSDRNQLVADKYRISAADLEDPACGIGDSLANAGTELFNFVEEWKKERHRSNQRMRERQKRLAARSKRVKAKRAKRKAKDAEEELWGSEDESNADLASLFVLSGPSASGKTSVVHAVGEKCECKVLEINTSEKRGGAALKQKLEEATVSHSSLDLLKQKQQKTFFAQQLVDSDESDSDDEEGAQLAMVLIDEVDLLFETHGDNAFWTALHDLAKKAKCPIVLTANTLPAHDLRNFKYQHARVEKPNRDECVARMRYILNGEGVELDQLDEDALPALAELLNHDMRRFCHELNSFAECDQSELEKSDLSPHFIERDENQAVVSTDSPNLPRLESVSPERIDPRKCNVLIVRGEGFLSLIDPSAEKNDYGYEIHASVGEQHCSKACIMDDRIAILVCGPFDRPKRSGNSSLFENEVDDLVEEYSPITLSNFQKRGMLSTTETCFVVETYGDGTLLCTTSKRLMVTLAYAEEPEMEASVTSTQNACTTEAASALLKKVTDELRSSEDLQEPPRMDDAPKLETADLMSECERMAGLASDAALLEFEMELGGMPFLSGACPGFGFDMTGESPQHVNGKPPSESKLFELGWKDKCSFYGSNDAFVTRPCSRYELNQLKIAALEGRSKNHRVSEKDRKDEEEEDWEPDEPSEEDCFVHNLVLPTLKALPLLFMEKVKPAWLLLEPVQTSNYRKWMQLLDEVFFFVEEKRYAFFGRGQCRQSIDAILSRDTFDQKALLDYIPMLRQMALYQAAAERYAKKCGAKSECTSRRRNRVCANVDTSSHNHFSLRMDYFQGRKKGHLDSKVVIDRLTKSPLCTKVPSFS